MRWGLASLFCIFSMTISPIGMADGIGDAIRNAGDRVAGGAVGKNGKIVPADADAPKGTPPEKLGKWQKDDGDDEKSKEEKIVIRKDSEQDRKRKEEDEQREIREWNKQQDKKAYEYRMEQMTAFQGSHGAVAPVYKPSAGDAPSITPYVSGEFKDAQGNLWKVIEGSPEKLADFSENESNETYAAPSGEETPARDLDSETPKEETTPVEESKTTSPERFLLSISSPGGNATANSYLGAQSNSFNIFMNAPSTPVSTTVVRAPASESRELTALEKSEGKTEEQKPEKAPTAIPNLTINNNISVEGATLADSGASGSSGLWGLGTQARLLLQKAFASTKGKTQKAPQALSDGKSEGRLSLEASYGSRGLASLESKASQPSFLFLALIVLISGLTIAGREVHKRKMWGHIAARFRKPRVAAAVSLNKNRVSEATCATSATRIYRR